MKWHFSTLFQVHQASCETGEVQLTSLSPPKTHSLSLTSEWAFLSHFKSNLKNLDIHFIYNFHKDTFRVFLRDGWRHQNGWIFGKVPKGGRGVISNPKIYIAKFGPLNRAFSTWKWYKRVFSGYVFQPITMLNCCTTCISWEIGSYNTSML